MHSENVRITEPGFMKLKDLHKVLNVSRNTAFRLVKSGKIAGTKIGAQWQVSQKALQEYIDSRTTQTVEP